MLRYTFVVASLSIVLSPTMSQEEVEGFTCKTNDPSFVERMFQDRPEALLRTHDAKMELDQWTAGSVRGGGDPFVIPVVFHIIHTNGAENISDAQVADAVSVLNEDFNKQNPDWTTVRPQFIDRVADVGIRFELAKRDPSGSCTNGITRTISDLTNEGDFAMTQLIQWPRGRYMNVWVGAQANGAAGYTNYPWVLDGSPNSDGIVIRSNYVGSIGTSSPGRSRVLSHEVGHWLNLMHCWGNSNDPGLPENCFEDDNVDDTPLTKGWTSCSPSGSSCGSELDNVENYMEYSFCGKMFTQGQGDRMIAALTSSIADRSQLWQEENQSFTGLSLTSTLCEAAFSSERYEVCAGESITFTDLSFNSVTQRTWDFEGGEPSSSSLGSPVVIYSTPGVYPVSLTVSDGLSTLFVAEPNAIRVLADPGAALPFAEGFESIASLSNTEWSTIDDGTNGFRLNAGIGATSGQSLHVQNGPTWLGETYSLVSSTYDLSATDAAVLRFDYAFARRAQTNNDLLRVLVSNDCGRTWSVRRQIWANTGLNTGGIIPGSFIPSEDQWAQGIVTNIGASMQVSGFRFKFEFVSDGGNDFFLDNINLDVLTTGVRNLTTVHAGNRIQPNPAQNSAQAIITRAIAGPILLTIRDLLGRTVSPPLTVWLSQGVNRIELPVEALSNGSYLVQIGSGSDQELVRLIVQRGF